MRLCPGAFWCVGALVRWCGGGAGAGRGGYGCLHNHLSLAFVEVGVASLHAYFIYADVHTYTTRYVLSILSVAALINKKQKKKRLTLG